MGRLVASALFLLGACGDNLVDGLGNLPDDDSGENGTVVPRYEPQVCGVMAWDPSIGSDLAQDVSVAARADGSAMILATPLGGGTLTGFRLDARQDMETDGIQKLPIDGNFARGTVSYVQDRPVSTAIADGAAYLHMLDETLTSAEYVAKVPATAIAEPTFFYAQGNLVMPVGTSEGLWMHRFQDSLEPIDSKLFKSTKPVLSVTAAQLQTNMMTAWSTETECYLHINSTYEPGITARVDAACPEPRLAVNELSGEAIMLFDAIGGIRMMPIYMTMFGGDAPILRADASSPRALHDGQRFWISYLDARGDVVVGFLDEDRKPVTVSLGAPQPERAAFEMVMVDGFPTVFSLDESGYTAYRMCVETIGE